MKKRKEKLSSAKIAKVLGATVVDPKDFRELTEKETKNCVFLGSAQGLNFFHCLHMAFNHSEKLRQYQRKKKIGYRFGIADKGYAMKVIFYGLP